MVSLEPPQAIVTSIEKRKKKAEYSTRLCRFALYDFLCSLKNSGLFEVSRGVHHTRFYYLRFIFRYVRVAARCEMNFRLFE